MATNSQTSNVIEVSFQCRRQGNPDEEVGYECGQPELTDDVLDELLGEFEDLSSLDSEESKEHFIYHHEKGWDFQLSYNDDCVKMSETVAKQVSRLKEDVKRIRYYLDELNLDK